MSTRLADYNYELPRELIAQHPLPRREDSRMMVLHRDEQKIEHARFVDLKKFLRDSGPSRTGGYFVVLDTSRVLAARLFSGDGMVEFVFLAGFSALRWRG